MRHSFDKYFKQLIMFPSVNRIEFAGEQSTGLIKGVSFGYLSPGMTARKILYLTSIGAGGERMLDVSVQSRDVGGQAVEGAKPVGESGDVQEHLQTLIVPVISPFTFSHQTAYSRRGDNPEYSLGDLHTFDKDYWDDLYGGEAHVQTTVTSAEGHNSISISGLKFVEEVSNFEELYSFSKLSDGLE